MNVIVFCGICKEITIEIWIYSPAQVASHFIAAVADNAAISNRELHIA